MQDKTDNLHTQIADFLKKKRLAMGLTVEEFAELIFKDSKSAGYVSKIENNKLQITVNTLNAILKNLNCSITINEH